MRGALLLGALLAAFWPAPTPAAQLVPDKSDDAVRVATFNASLSRKGAGVLIKDIDARDPQVLAVAEIILRVRPDILLLNEIDHDPQGIAVDRFRSLLAESVGDLDGLDYPHSFVEAPNTGVPSGFDLDGDGKIMGPRDALGFGRFPGQYGMAVLSRFALGEARTFKDLKWAQIPWAIAPVALDGSLYYGKAAWARLPLSSKSHWDVPVTLPDGRILHALASHPTPPVFDGPEDRNGLRNAAEIRFWIDYIEGAAWIVDDAGMSGGLSDSDGFVVLGDLNADPARGDGDRRTIGSLLTHPRIWDPRPESPGAAAAGAHVTAARDTADWPETDGPGNLRVDYVLPSAQLDVTASGVFWPAPDEPLARLTRIDGRTRASSDHRLVWVDIRMEDR